MKTCLICGKPNWSFIHAPFHPSNRGNEAITHIFVPVGAPQNNIMDDDMIAWAVGA